MKITLFAATLLIVLGSSCVAPVYQSEPNRGAYRAVSPPPSGVPMSFGAWTDHYHPDLAGRRVSQSLYKTLERDYQTYQQSVMFNQQMELERERLRLERERVEMMRAQQEAEQRTQD